MTTRWMENLAIIGLRMNATDGDSGKIPTDTGIRA